ncbi:MAG: 2TM domain-containing protein, partial [Alphaproteobacteria bacterium]|nr:2TM domain-containing protein [Alphaproteobacteria bacterium]
MNEHQARLHVKKLRRFYTDILIYTVVNLGLILIWAISGGGTFWPIWVIVGWGIGLGVHAFSLGLLPQIDVMVPFLTTEWEEQEVRRLMKEEKKPKAGEAKIEVTTVKSAVKENKKTTPS